VSAVDKEAPARAKSIGKKQSVAMAMANVWQEAIEWRWQWQWKNL
jgi:hypothetical protein